MSYTEEKGRELCPSVTLSLCDKTLRTETTGDYVLPDYQPEIRRVLHVIPTVLPPAKYVGNGSVEWNGTVDYQVFYVGADGEMYTLSLSSEYGGSVPMEGAERVSLNEGITVLVTSLCEGVTTRVSGPRRLSIRCRLSARIRAYGSLPMETRETGVQDASTLQRHTLEEESMRLWCDYSDGILCRDEIEGVSEETRVISAVAEAVVEGARWEPEGLRAVGEVTVHMLLVETNGKIRPLSRKLPLDGVIEGEGGNGPCCVRCTVGEIRVQTEEGRLQCEVTVLLEARCAENVPVTFVDDAYALDFESECRYVEVPVCHSLGCGTGNFSQSERIPVSEVGLSEGAEVLTCFGNAWFEECRGGEGRYLLSGKSRYVLLCERSGEYFSAEVVRPIRYETEGTGEAPDGFDAVASVMNCRARLEGETLCVDTEWAVSTEFTGSKTVTGLEEVSLIKPLSDAGSCMTVYYPSAEDTSWSIAKKYHVSPEDIQENGAYYLF